MESMILLCLVAAFVIAPVTPVSIECINGNCTETTGPAPNLRLNLASIFPFFGPVNFDAARDREPLNDAIDPMEPPTNSSDPAEGVISIRIVRVFSIQGDPNEDLDQSPSPSELGRPQSDLASPFLQKMFDNIMADIGILDLSGKDLTSSEVYSALAARKAEGHPVSTLILSNSRIHPMDAGTFAAAESTLETLVMANTSVNLDALRGLTNLKVLNLSDNGLSTFPWYTLMADTLEVLDLSHNEFAEVRPELSMLKNLRELYLQNNKISAVEEAPLILLPNLETLDLSMNQLQKANLAGLVNLNRVDMDWNFLRLMGRDCLLPPQPVSLKLASNPWRCDCGLLQARDGNEVLDLDLLQCSKHSNVYNNKCAGCERPFLPDRDGLQVAPLTKDLIDHQGCNDVPGLYNYVSDEYVKLSNYEPEYHTQDVVLFIAIVLTSILCIFFIIKICCPTPATESKLWVKAQEIPKWSFDKLGTQQEVPYNKMEKTPVKE